MGPGRASEDLELPVGSRAVRCGAVPTVASDRARPLGGTYAAGRSLANVPRARARRPPRPLTAGVRGRGMVAEDALVPDGASISGCIADQHLIHSISCGKGEVEIASVSVIA